MAPPQPGGRAAPAEGAELPQHIPALDGIRGAALLLVLIVHFTFLDPRTSGEIAFSQLVGSGWIGVDVFFVLSGFLITGILLDTRDKPAYFRTFYARRSLRIFPLYYAYLALLFLLLPLLRPHQLITGQAWIWTYLANVRFASVGWEGMPDHTTHLWSLAVEEQFYLLWPLVVFLVPRRHLPYACLITIAGASLTRIALLDLAPDGISGYMLLPARMDSLAFGGLLALLVREQEARARLGRAALPALVLSCAALAGVAVHSLRLDPASSLLPPLAPHVQVLGYPLVALASGCLVLLAVEARAGSLLARLLTSAPLLSCGRYSYGVYVLHVPLRNITKNLVAARGGIPMVGGSQLPAQLLLLAFAILASWCLGWLSWHLLEGHVLALKRHFEYGHVPSAPPPLRVPAQPAA